MEKDIKYSTKKLKTFISINQKNFNFREMIEEIDLLIQNLNLEIRKKIENKNLRNKLFISTDSKNNSINIISNKQNHEAQADFKNIMKETKTVNSGNFLINCNICKYSHTYFK